MTHTGLRSAPPCSATAGVHTANSLLPLSTVFSQNHPGDIGAPDPESGVVWERLVAWQVLLWVKTHDES